MSTAQEIAMKIQASDKVIARMAQRFESHFHDCITYWMALAIGREVSARRARKLRKRGDDVRYVGRTKTGKARYSWMRRIAPWAIYMPNAEVSGLSTRPPC